MSTKAIEQFLRTPHEGGAYTEGRLAELLAHAEDGKLMFQSCCCFVGIPTAGHALQGEMAAGAPALQPHLQEARQLPHAKEAETEFLGLGWNSGQMRHSNLLACARLIPLIKVEFARREAMRNTSTQPPACAAPLSEAVENHGQAHEPEYV